MSFLEIKKLFTDSRSKTLSSKTSNFRINPLETLAFENNTCIHSDDLCCGHSWT